MIYLMDRTGHLACTWSEDAAHVMETEYGYRRISAQEYERRYDSACIKRNPEGRESDSRPVRG